MQYQVTCYQPTTKQRGEFSRFGVERTVQQRLFTLQETYDHREKCNQAHAIKAI